MEFGNDNYLHLGVDCGDPGASLLAERKKFVNNAPPEDTKCCSEVTIECEMGYIFADLNGTHSITCQPNAEWSVTPTCTSKFVIIIFCFI